MTTVAKLKFYKFLMYIVYERGFKWALRWKQISSNCFDSRQNILSEIPRRVVTPYILCAAIGHGLLFN